MSSVSIVVPVKNGARFIAEALRSGLDQGSLVAEIIVVDDGSTDGTREIALGLGDPRIRVVANRSTGPSGGRNTGAALAVGDWLYFLDADDRARPGALATLMEGAALGDVDVVYGDYERMDTNGRPIGRRASIRFRHKPSGDVLGAMLRGNFIVNGGVALVRRSAFERVGGFDERLRYLEDWHLWVRLSTFARFRHLPGKHIMDYRIHGASLMHGAPKAYNDFRPALDAMFTDALVCGRMPSLALAGLRPIAEAHVRTYLATEAIRGGRYTAGMTSALTAMTAKPSRAMHVMAKVFGTLVGL